MTSLRSFFVACRQSMFNWLVEWEIYHKLFPHLEREKECDYPFHSDTEFQQWLKQSRQEARFQLDQIDRQASQMPQAYGEAFQYIAYREFNTHLNRYRQLAQRRVLRNPPKRQFAS